MNRLLLIVFIAGVWPFYSHAQVAGSSQVVQKIVIGYKDTTRLHFLYDPSIYSDGWNRLPQTVFWREIINLTADTFLINIPSCRQTIQRIFRDDWKDLNEADKKLIKDSLICLHNLDANSSLFVTAGKGEFYELKKVLPDISRSISVFENNGVDPWYAQTILLIESPGKAKQKSSVGANGPFQLMPSVARKYGLIVNRHRDDRSNLEKSAAAAAKLIRSSCIPYIKDYLGALGLTYSETDLWFRLLVLHAYHAGAGNVRCALFKMQPKKGGMDLIKELWQTQCGGFKNESQNYSQIALASITNFEDLIRANGDTVFLVSGDKQFTAYKKSSDKPQASYDYLRLCLASYENDFVDGIIPYEYFMKRVGQVRKEMRSCLKSLNETETKNLSYAYPAAESQLLSVTRRLLNKQRSEDAIKLLKLDLESRPNSADAFQLLAKAYMQSGNKQLASVYSSRVVSLRINNADGGLKN